MKKAVIVALAALNVGLLAWVLTIHSTPADAQMAARGADYIQVSGRVGGTTEAVYVIDLKARSLKGWYYNADRLVELRGRDLTADFKRDGRDR